MVVDEHCNNIPKIKQNHSLFSESEPHHTYMNDSEMSNECDTIKLNTVDLHIVSVEKQMK